MPNTPAAENLPSSEVEKRTQSFNARKALLRSNPSLYVSRTRLSIRQLPLFATERMLKRLAIHALRSFKAEVKAGSRLALTPDELTEPLPDPDADDYEDASSKGKGKAKALPRKGRNTGVKQAKIVRQQDRVDAVTGKGRSRGYGFLEMERHADAFRFVFRSFRFLPINEPIVLADFSALTATCGGSDERRFLCLGSSASSDLTDGADLRRRPLSTAGAWCAPVNTNSQARGTKYSLNAVPLDAQNVSSLPGHSR